MNTNIDALISDVQGFYGQDVYSGMGSVIGRNNRLALLVMKFVKVGSRFTFVNGILVVSCLIGLRYFRVPDEKGTVFQYGISRNNKIAFDKLNSCVSVNNEGYKPSGVRLPTVIERLKAVIPIVRLLYGAKALSLRAHSDPYVHLQSVISIAAFLFYSANSFPAGFRVLCIANDHNPICLALLRIGHLEGLKTVYVQHAPVTRDFPPLKTDLSVLYDIKSVEAYRNASKRCGLPFRSVFVLMPPFDSDFVFPSLSQSSSVVVGVCISRFPMVEALSKLLFSLCESSSVTSIILRPHPACSANLSALTADPKVSLQKRDATIDQFSSTITCALVPTSGVAIELLHKGVPSFYTPGLDDIAYDYYGFVADRILPVFDMNAFWEAGFDSTFYDAAWSERFSMYDMTVKKSLKYFREDVETAITKMTSV